MACQDGALSYEYRFLAGKKALIISSAHSSRYGYLGRTVTAGTVLGADDKIRVLIGEGRFKGNIWEVPLGEVSIQSPTAELCATQSDGVWAADAAPGLANPEVVLLWEQWQPE